MQSIEPESTVLDFNLNLTQSREYMKADLSSIIEGIEFQTEQSQTYLNKISGKVIIIADEEMDIANTKSDISDYPDWMQNAINTAKEYLEDQDNYLRLLSARDIDEYRIMENFILSLPNEAQKNEMYGLIKGRGAFSGFRQGLERFALTDQWYAYRDDELVRFAKQWCEDNDIDLKS